MKLANALQPVSTKKMLIIQNAMPNEDMFQTVLRYCYYNSKDAKQINETKRKKAEVAALITLALSRNTEPMGNHWAFGIYPFVLDVDDPRLQHENLQLQAVNCQICGEYERLSRGDLPQTSAIRCKCHTAIDL